MASYGKSYPDRAGDPRRQISREQMIAREAELAAFDAMMREAPGTGPINELGDYMLKKDKK